MNPLVGNSPLIVIGMHRSGTTMICSVLESLGVFMGNDKECNNESMFFLRLNEWIFRQAGASWDRPLAMRDLAMDHRVLSSVVKVVDVTMQGWGFKRYLGWYEYWRNKNMGVKFPQWGWKDPRNSFTLPIWKHLFPNAKVILVTRHGVDVANSLQVRSSKMLSSFDSNYLKNKMRYGGLKFRLRNDEVTNSIRCLTLTGSFTLWEEYMEEGASVPVDDNFMEVKYEKLLADPHTWVKRIADFCSLCVGDQKISAICAGINEERAYAYRKDEALLTFAGKVTKPLSCFGYEA